MAGPALFSPITAESSAGVADQPTPAPAESAGSLFSPVTAESAPSVTMESGISRETYQPTSLLGRAAKAVARTGAPSPGSIVELAARSLPSAVSGLFTSGKSGATLPHDVYQGEASDTDTGRVLDLATFGAGSAPRVAMRLSPWEASLGELRRSLGEAIGSRATRAERAAGKRLTEASTNPEQTIEQLGPWGGAQELVPGSKPTAGQASGDYGLLGLERETMLKPENRAAFLQRGEEQKTAQVEALRGVAGEGKPQAVADTLRSHLDTIDRATQAEVDRLTAEAQAAGEKTGGKGAPEDYGEKLREQTNAALAKEKEHERNLWNAVDPDGKLAVDMRPMQAAADAVYGRLSKAGEAGLTAEEAKIRGLIGEYRGVEPFREVTDLRSMINSAMRAERRTAGESAAYRRLTQLRQGVEEALGAAAQGAHEAEAQAVARGGLLPADTMAARIGAEAPKVGNTAYTASGTPIETRYRVVEGDQLVTSHNADLSPNAAFPAELQPRDRARAASVAQVNRMARRLQPDRLGASASAGEGAPIIGPDGIVESGNARVLAIRQAHGEGGTNAAAYRQHLIDQGYPEAANMRDPVLVRERLTPMSDAERQAFTREANVSQTAHVSAAERAATDSGKLSDETLARYKGGDISAAENRDFVRDFSRNVVERSEEGAFATKDGRLSLEGERRINNALTHAAYGDTNLVARLAESGDESIKSLGGALMDAAGDMAQLRRAIDAGHVSANVDLAPHILNAIDMVSAARARGIPLVQVVAQRDAFAPVDQVAHMVLEAAYGQNLAGRINRGAFTDALRSYVREAVQQTTEARLFGEPSSAAEILEAQGGARRAAGQATGGVNLGEGAGTAGAPRGQPREAPAGAPARGGGEATDRVVEQPSLAPNFDQAARERLSAATAATKERAGKFGQGPVKQVLRSSGNKGEYVVPDAEVGSKYFKPGLAGQARVEALRKAVGDGPALETLQDYAASRLRAEAMPDGTLDPKKFEGWMRRHAPALQSFPELRAKFATAEKASAAIEDAALARTEALKGFQTAEVKKLLAVESDADVARIVGGVLGRDDSVARMGQLVERLRGNPDALAGLRHAVADHIYNRMIGAKEVGVSGLKAIKEGEFSNFVRKNLLALKVALPAADVATLERLSADMTRAKRTLEAVRVQPGQSNTTQDMWKLVEEKVGGAHHSMFDNVFGWAIMAHELGGGHLAAAAGVGAKIAYSLIAKMRAAGMARVDDLVKQAILDPALARTLMLKAQEQNMPRFKAALDRSTAARPATRAGLGNVERGE